MRKGKYLLFILILLVAACCWYGKDVYNWYYTKRTQAYIKEKREHRANDPWNRRMVDSGIAQLHTGDLVMRRGSDITSYMLCQMNQEDKTYSHCGIVIVENGYPFVYHSIGGEDNPDEHIRRDSVSFFFSPLNNLGYGIARYELDSAQVQKLCAMAKRFYAEKRKFDLDFDLKSDDRLYCSEFACKALMEATGDTSYIKTTTAHDLTFIGIDNLYRNAHARLICQIEYK